MPNTSASTNTVFCSCGKDLTNMDGRQRRQHNTVCHYDELSEDSAYSDTP